MKFIHITSAETNQDVYIPVERIGIIRYPVGDKKRTLITWSSADGTTQLEIFKERPMDFRFMEV